MDCLAAQVAGSPLEAVLHAEFTQGRKLDTGNPNPGNIGADFNRIGLKLWDEVKAQDIRNEGRHKRLETLNAWRNAIVHQDFDPAKLGGRTKLVLEDVKKWRRALKGLALSIDIVMKNHLRQLTGVDPW